MTVYDHAPAERLVPRRTPDRSEPNLLDLIPPADSIADRFAVFHAEHPEVYVELVRLAREAKAAGVRVGMKALWERLRWSFTVDRPSGKFKLNNVYTARYARLIMENEPDLRGLFETRRLRSERTPT